MSAEPASPKESTSTQPSQLNSEDEGEQSSTEEDGLPLFFGWRDVRRFLTIASTMTGLPEPPFPPDPLRRGAVQGKPVGVRQGARRGRTIREQCPALHCATAHADNGEIDCSLLPSMDDCSSSSGR